MTDYKNFKYDIANTIKSLQEEDIKKKLDDSYKSKFGKKLSQDEYSICVYFFEFLTRDLFPEIFNKLNFIEYYWSKKLKNIISNNQKLELIEDYQCRLIQHLKSLEKRTRIQFTDYYEMFFLRVHIKTYYPLSVENDILERRIKLVQDIRANRKDFSAFTHEFYFLRDYQRWALEFYYLKFLHDELSQNDNELKFSDFYPNIFTSEIAANALYSIIKNRLTFFEKPGPALYSRLYHLLVDEKLIYAQTSKKAYVKMISEGMKVHFKQFDNKTMYTSKEQNILNKVLNEFGYHHKLIE
ncbi:hypothetical protein ML462_01110 [Gramella lutea]|uniref:Uncharacterized protein n=1 Tax=Christiangramia lutea TaxID=1607951 RepID=A0A9X2AA65_9FLAO|nr:hypothetical protein [Christiangramia lutea]MCH4821758.1 hypothetical protein [Christiangramia lutea]